MFDPTAFENLELIPILLKKMNSMEERLKKFVPSLTSKKAVASFLGVTTRTINNYAAEGILIEDYHFKRKDGKISVFIEDAILEFREQLNKGKVNEKVTI